MTTLLAGYVLIGAAVSLLTYLVTNRPSPAAEPVAVAPGATPPIAELKTRTVTDAPVLGANLHEVLLQRSRSERMVKPWLAKLGKLASGGTPKGHLDNLHELAVTAGIARTWTPQRISIMRKVTLVAGLLLAAVSWRAMSGMMGTLFSVIVALIGWRAIDIWLTSRARVRQEEITHHLPDVADQIAISVQAGLGFEMAIRRTVESTEGPLSEELARLLYDVRVGIARSEAFRNLQDRVDVPDMTSFVRAIAQAERSGVPIADILQIQADELREKRKQRAEERAMKLPVLMLVPLVTCILPPLLIILLGPPMLELLDGGLT